MINSTVNRSFSLWEKVRSYMQQFVSKPQILPDLQEVTDHAGISLLLEDGLSSVTLGDYRSYLGIFPVRMDIELVFDTPDYEQYFVQIQSFIRSKGGMILRRQKSDLSDQVIDKLYAHSYTTQESAPANSGTGVQESSSVQLKDLESKYENHSYEIVLNEWADLVELANMLMKLGPSFSIKVLSKHSDYDMYLQTILSYDRVLEVVAKMTSKTIPVFDDDGLVLHYEGGI